MKTPTSLLLSAMLATALTACAPSGDGEEAVASEAASVAEATIAFAADGSVHHDAIPTGAKIDVAYDVRRLTQCGVLTAHDAPDVQVDLYYLTRTGHTHVSLGRDWVNETVTRVTLGPFDAGDAGDLQIWFRASNGAGCEAWDSAHGHNHHFALGEVSGYADVAPRIAAACSGCHGDRFATLERLQDQKSAMIGRISAGSMPRNNPGWKDTADGHAVLAFLRSLP